MSQKELTKQHVIQSCIDKLITVKQAAARLRLSERRILQLKKEYLELGPVACIHGNARRSSPRKLPEELCQCILETRRMPIYSETNFTHFKELLEIYFGIRISYSALSRLLRKNKYKSPKSRRRKKDFHPLRERKPAEGLLLQADATPFSWFSGQPRMALHGFIDDATGKITGLYLCRNECLLGYLEVLRQTLVTFGIPQSLYPDRYSVFFHNPKKENGLSVEEQLAGLERKPTQFGRIVERLGIDMFPAHSAQAKGRIERLWDTLQSRLPVEFALRSIDTIDAANTFLPAYVEQFNKQFSVSPKESFSAFVPVPHTTDLDRLLSVEFYRKLSSGSTISLNGILFLIEQNHFPARTEVTLLLSEKHGLRALINGAFYPIHPFDDNTKENAAHLPRVILDLINRYLFVDAKVA